MDGEKFNPEEFGRFGFGNIRTLREYEKYAGLEFSTRKIHLNTVNKVVPNLKDAKMSDEDFEAGLIVKFKHFLDIWHEDLPERDYDFIVVALHGVNDETLYRKDFQPNEIAPIVYNEKNFKVFLVEAPEIVKPSSWVVWPHSVSKGWGKRITGLIK